jgi:hypothetical protein
MMTAPEAVSGAQEVAARSDRDRDHDVEGRDLSDLNTELIFAILQGIGRCQRKRTGSGLGEKGRH